MPLSKPIQLKGYNRAVAERPVTYVIYSKLLLTDYSEFILPIIIADLGRNAAILGKS